MSATTLPPERRTEDNIDKRFKEYCELLVSMGWTPECAEIKAREIMEE